MIRVLLADDQVLVRAGFRSLIETAEGIEVVGEASNGDEAIAQSHRLSPDVILMDIRMPGTDGLKATHHICGATGTTGPRIIMLTTYEADEYVYEAIHAGASGFLVKDTEPVDLFNAIRVVAAGEALLSPRVTRRLITDIARRPDRATVPAQLDQLTDREREIMTLVATGMSNIEIAQSLFLSPHTAKTHINRAMSKLGARDRAQLVVIAYENGMLNPHRDKPS